MTFEKALAQEGCGYVSQGGMCGETASHSMQSNSTTVCCKCTRVTRDLEDLHDIHSGHSRPNIEKAFTSCSYHAFYI